MLSPPPNQPLPTWSRLNCTSERERNVRRSIVFDTIPIQYNLFVADAKQFRLTESVKAAG